MLRVNQVHHIAIICSDYPKSKLFYTEVLGFSVISETYREDRNSYKLDLGIGNQYVIELFSFPNSPERVDQPEACGLRHLAFEIDDFEVQIAELEAKGIYIEPVRIDPISLKKYTFLKDPDGLPIELCSR